MTDPHNMFNVKQCPICKKDFIQTSGEWCYKELVGEKKIYYCSYSCMNKAIENRKPNPSVKFYDLYDKNNLIEENIKELEKRNKIRGFKHNSYTRTEQLLYLYPYLEKFNEQHIKISNALEKIKDDKYYNAIEMRYFEGMTFEKIANKYNVKHQTIYTHNKKLVNTLAKILFPNEVAKEILND